MRLILGLFSLVLLAGCGAVPSSQGRLVEGETVAIQKLLTETRGRPYECFEYDGDTDTCSGLAKWTVRGDVIRFDLKLLAQGPALQPVTVNIAANFLIEGNRFCGNFKRADLRTEGKMTPAQKSLFDELFLVEMIMLGDICGSYVQESSGTYFSLTTDRSGRLLEDGVAPVQFFSRPKSLRMG